VLVPMGLLPLAAILAIHGVRRGRTTPQLSRDGGESGS
jgi:hypothetical protein